MPHHVPQASLVAVAAEPMPSAVADAADIGLWATAAVRHVAWQGESGAHVRELWAALPYTASDEAARAWLWKQLRVHPELCFHRDSAAAGSSKDKKCKQESQAVPAAEVAGLALADAAGLRVAASERARAWSLGTDPKGLACLSAKQAKTLDCVSRTGAAGTVPHELSKASGQPPNELFYTTKFLESIGLVHRSPTVLQQQ
jgi:hypothetical protein